MTDFNTIKRLLEADRSVRRFKEYEAIGATMLETLVGLTRYCASGRNAQPLRYRIVTDAEERETIFPLLKWAGYLPEWGGPAKGERPAAYLVQCLDTTYGNDCLCDDGLQLQAITLGATALGLGACIIKAFNAPEVARLLNLPERMQPRYILALGRPAETVVLEDTDGTAEADIRYYRTPDATHHVPKRPLSELIIK